jgi:hypothetical protein
VPGPTPPTEPTGEQTGPLVQEPGPEPGPGPFAPPPPPVADADAGAAPAPTSTGPAPTVKYGGGLRPGDPDRPRPVTKYGAPPPHMTPKYGVRPPRQ